MPVWQSWVAVEGAVGSFVPLAVPHIAVGVVHEALVPPPDPAQVHVHGAAPEKEPAEVADVPVVQSPVVVSALRAANVVSAVALPHAPLTATLAADGVQAPPEGPVAPQSVTLAAIGQVDIGPMLIPRGM